MLPFTNKNIRNIFDNLKNVGRFDGDDILQQAFVVSSNEVEHSS
jgi:hypothetical protein